MAGRRDRRRRRRRGGFGLIAKLLCILAICAMIVTALTLFFKVDTVVVSGQSRYTEQEVKDASGVKPGDNLFLLNKFGAANRILEQLPYVEEVQINRVLPDTLSIKVAECSRTFAVEENDVAWLISVRGKIVDSCDPGAVPAGTPVVDGCELLSPSVGSKIALATDRQPQQAGLLNLLSALDDAGLIDQVDAVHLDSVTELTMDYGERFTVRLQYGADYAYKLRNLQAVIDALETNQTGTIDLTKDGEAHFLPE